MLEMDPCLKIKGVLNSRKFISYADNILLWSDNIPGSEVLQRLVQDFAPSEPLLPAVRRQEVSQDCHVTWE